MSIIQEAKAKNKKIFFQMGGQGSPWYRELKKIYDSNEIKTFFKTCFDVFNEMRPLTEGAIATPKGLNPEEWLKNENSIPSNEYLSTAGVSLVMIQMTQLAYYELFRNKYPYSEIQNIVAGATGHSQGLISTTLLGFGLENQEYYNALRFYMKYIIYLALRAQEVFPYIEPNKEELQLSEELNLKDPSPMVVVLGSDHKTISELVNQFNQKYQEEKPIYIGLYNTPNNRVLSSYRKSLLLFYKENMHFIEENKIKYIFLKTTCPFHSPYMDPSVPKVLEDIKKENFPYNTKDFKFPIYTFSNGQDYRTSEDLLPTMTKDLLVNTLHWDLALRSLTQLDVSYIIDFGPGKTSQRLSEETLQSLSFSIPILCMANPKEANEIL
ncbi:MAG: hypothetical protein ACK4UJ_08810 [Leptonema sp. (in: bacteria)]